jgi:LPS sulfotransferase NodH
MSEDLSHTQIYDLLRASADYPPWDGPPRQTLVICTQQRSGSTLLAEAIHFAGGLGNPQEYLHRGFRPILEQRWGRSGIAAYLASLHRFRTDPSGVFSIKLFWRDVVDFIVERSPVKFAALAGSPAWRPDDNLYADVLSSLSEFLPNPTFVYLTRRDNILQAISLAVAGQTNLWRQYSGGRATASGFQPVYNFDEIVQFLAGIQNGDAHWLNFFRANGLRCHRIVYEDLARDYDGTLRSLFHSLGRPDATILPPRLHKHADSFAEKWLGRFTADFRARARGG